MTLEVILSAAIGIVLGFLSAWYIRGKDIKGLQNEFKAIASDVLRLNSQDFLQIAKKDLESTKALVGADLENKGKEFEKIAGVIGKSIESLTDKVNRFEKERGEQFGSLGANIKQVLETGIKMADVTNDLKAVLSSSGAIRGRWGEAVLKNLLEGSGLTEGIDFAVQETIGNDESGLRPDVIVNLPGELRLAIDSKASLDDFFRAVEEKEQEHKADHIKKFVDNLKSRVRDLSAKEYQQYLDKKIPFVVMFVPSEAAVRAVFEYDADFYRYAQEKKIMLASPTTVMPLVLLIAHAWKQYRSATNAAKLSEEVADLGNKLKTFFEHMAGIGLNLKQTTEKFNAAAGSWESRVLPKIEKIKELGGDIQSVGSIKMIDEKPRLLKKPPR